MTALATVVAAALSCAAVSHPIVTEVYYDANGDDTGREFVELWNPGTTGRSLAGLRLEAGDGGGPGRWTLRWTGQAADSLPPGARFVIGGAQVAPPPNVVINLELQNGPDAMRLLWPDGASEIVGWGAHEHTEYYCGAAAVDVASGQSLARIPDAAATGGNAGDFRAADPSPGGRNLRTVDAALLRRHATLEPPQPPPNAAATLTLSLHDPGATAWGVDDGKIVVTSELLAGEVAVNMPAMAPGETLRVEVALPALRAGRGAIIARVVLHGDESPGNDVDTLLVRVGPGPLALREIQFHPAAGEGEWIEVRNRDALPLALERFRVGDRSGAGGTVEAGVPLAPESLAVLAQDPVALLMARPSLDATRVRRVSPWAALNNSDDATGVADQVQLAESDGVPVERVSYSAAGIASGVTLEYRDDSWRPSEVVGGTPLAPPLSRPPVAGGFRADPRRLKTSGETVRFSWELPWPSPRVTLELYDLEGRRSRRLAGPVASGVRGERPVTLTALAPGIYLAVLRAESDDGTFTRVAPLRVDADRP
jgi:hypothetical protein